MPWQFTGFPKYLATAGEGYDPHTIIKAKNQPAVSALSSLLAQAASAPEANRKGIILAARDWVTALGIAYEAAMAMYGEAVAELVARPEPDQESAPKIEFTDERDWAEFKAANHGVKVEDLPENPRPTRRRKV